MGKSKKSPASTSTKKYSERWAWCLLAAVILFVAVVRIRLLSVPLERDEGEFAYLGQLMLQGVPPYKLGYNMKFPGIYAAYAVIMAVFGQSTVAIHLGLLFINIGAIIFLFLVARRLFGFGVAVTASISYALLTLSQSVVGFAAHATHFVVLFALAGIWLMLKAIESERWYQFLISGLLFGTAYTMKQPGLLFSVFAATYIASESIKRKVKIWSAMGRIGLLAVGAVVPFGIICLTLWKMGVFDKFWFWTFDYGREYASMVTPYVAKALFLREIGEATDSSELIWGLAVVGIAASVFSRELRSQRYFLLGFLLFSFLAVCPGFYFRKHYFVLMLPALAVLSGVAVCSMYSGLRKLNLPHVVQIIPIILFIVVIGLTIQQQADCYFTLTPEEVCRAQYSANPFPESIKIADYLRKHTNKNDRILVFGSEPQIYFYAQRHSATGFIYVYPLMEQHKYAARMQNEMYSEIVAAKPKYIVMVFVSTSWGVGNKSRTKIIVQLDKYVKKYYEPVGIADMVSAGPSGTNYYWGEKAQRTVPQSQYYLVTYKRTTSR